MLKENFLCPEGWEQNKNFLKKTFTFKGYLKTVSFINAVAWHANQHNHHPEITFGFNFCTLILTTHDEDNTVTEKDLKLAQIINELL